MGTEKCSMCVAAPLPGSGFRLAFLNLEPSLEPAARCRAPPGTGQPPAPNSEGHERAESMAEERAYNFWVETLKECAFCAFFQDGC